MEWTLRQKLMLLSALLAAPAYAQYEEIGRSREVVFLYQFTLN